jgi:hypothetical protein
MKRQMRRQGWLILTLAALFGLRAPLCMVACLETETVAPLAGTMQHPAEHASCHDAAPEPTEAPPASEHACDCDEIEQVVAKSDSRRAVGIQPMPAAPLPLLSQVFRVGAEVPAPLLAKRHQALPPADILLLKATLLL